MEHGTNEQADDDEEQHIGDALAAEYLAKEVGREDEQTYDGNGKADLARRAAVGDLFGYRVDQVGIRDGVGGMDKGVVDARKGVGGGDEVGLNHGGGLLVEQSPADTDVYTAVACWVVGGYE